MPLTQAQYEEREAFMLDLVAAQRELRQMVSLARARGANGRLTNLREQVEDLYSEINGSGVRQGSLYPPTTTQRQRWAVMQAQLEQMRRE